MSVSIAHAVKNDQVLHLPLPDVAYAEQQPKYYHCNAGVQGHYGEQPVVDAKRGIQWRP